MGGLKTFLRMPVLLVALLIAAFPPAPALAADRPGLRLFAHCAGRLSALVEDQWMFDGPASERTAAELRAMAGLVDAVMPDGAGPEVLSWRINAKEAYRALLTSARMADSPDRRTRAGLRAEALIAECRSLMLG
jgi:hypothetical protein